LFRFAADLLFRLPLELLPVSLSPRLSGQRYRLVRLLLLLLLLVLLVER
jgi:hypothetical protein